MKTSDVLKALTLIKIAFPQAYSKLSPQELDAMSNLWVKCFQDRPAEELNYAVGFYISNNTSGFAPTIGQLNDIIYKAYHPEISEFEAWSAIKNATSQSGDYESAKREWSRLPEVVQVMISPRDLCRLGRMETDIVDTTVSAMIRKSLSVVQHRTQEQASLPSSVKQLITWKKIPEIPNE